LCLSRAITGLDERAIAPQILSEVNVQIRREFRFHNGTYRDFFYSLVDMTGLLSSGLLNYMVCVCGVVICTKGVGTSAGGMLRR